MVVMFPFVEFEGGFAGLEMVALEQAGLLELGQYAVHRGQADVHAVVEQVAIDVFGRDVAGNALLFELVEEVEDLESGEGGLEADVLEVVRLGGHARMI